MELWDCALGFMHSQIVFAAHDLGVFERLERPSTLDELAEVSRIPRDSAERLLAALCALELVERGADGLYQNLPATSAQVVRGKPQYIGGLFQHLREAAIPAWHHLPDALLEGHRQWERAYGDRAAPTEQIYEDPERLRAFMAGMHALTYEAGREYARQATELSLVRSIVDVGGASGAFLIALAERYPDLRGTVFDLPPVRPIAEEHISRAGLGERIRFRAGDFFRDPLPRNADAYALGFVLHDWDEAGGAIVLDKVAQAARPGALLIVSEFLLSEDKTGPLFVARSDLNMLVVARGRERTASEYRAFIAAHGFELETIRPSRLGKFYLVFRRGARASTR